MTITDKQFDYARKMLLERSGIALEDTKKYLVEARLGGLAQEQKLGTVGELLEMLSAKPFGPVHQSVVEAMTTNETYFFRDIHPFDALQKFVIPELIAKRGPRKALRIWSAASSTGQEAYSIAMILYEHFPATREWKIEIIGTDLSTGVLSVARAGRYTQLEVNRGLPATYLIKYFTQHGQHWQVKDEIRSMARFQEINLTAEWPFLGKFDIVMIRNVLIYFNPETKRRILARIHPLMEPDGTLFLGGSETTLGLTDKFDPVPLGGTTAYRQCAGAKSASVDAKVASLAK